MLFRSAALEQALPEFASGFLAARQAVVRTPGALPTWARELLLAILSADAGFGPGGRNHLGAALAAGLTRAQLDEALGCLVLVRGLSAWDRVGGPLLAAADELEPTPTRHS